MNTLAQTNPFATRGENERKVLQRDPNPHIFRPLALRSITTRNRIVLSPMCQYSAADGVPNDWHFQHLASRAVGGVGIVFTEVTHVEPRGRITPGCLGLWNDEQRDAFARITRFIKAQGALAGIQIGHAGRKASTAVSWDGGKPLTREMGGWALRASVQLAQVLKAGGKVDLIDCSSGALSPTQKLTVHPGYQVPFAAEIRSRADIATGAVGLIQSADMAEQIVANGQADLIFLGRAMLGEPYWPLQAARTLRARLPWSRQYERGDIY